MNNLSEPTSCLIVMSNFPDEKSARLMALLLIERRLAACVNIMPAMRSIYRWQDVVEEATEVALIVKTTRACYAELEAAIKSAHPYEVPEIIAIPFAAGLPPYLEWIVQQTTKDDDV